MRLALCFLLSLVAAPAWGEWVKVGESDEITAYVDFTSIRRNGRFRQVWEIQDLKKRYKDGEMSRRILYEYDCKERRHRGLSASDHTEPMAGGRILVSIAIPSAWSRIEPSSVDETILKIVCTK
jgi:hypothetical protein